MKRPLLLFLVLSTACAHATREGVVAGVDASPATTGEAPRSEGARDPDGAAPPKPRPSASADARPGAPEVATAAPAQERPAAESSADPRPAADLDARERLVRAARRHLGRPFAGDCSAFVRRVFTEADVMLPGLRTARTMTESLYRSMRPVTKPEPGDLAYFRRTRRRDRGGRGRSDLSHVAIVEAVDGSRVTMIHRTSRGIRRLQMNLERPHDREENGVLRRRRASDGRRLPSLAGELFAGYATALSRRWQPPPIVDREESVPRARLRTLGRRPPRR